MEDYNCYQDKLLHLLKKTSQFFKCFSLFASTKQFVQLRKKSFEEIFLLKPEKKPIRKNQETKMQNKILKSQ